MNVVVLSGRLVKPPKAGTSSNGKGYVLFTLAVRKNKEEADFIDCLAYDADASLIAQYCKQGSALNVTGRLSQRKVEIDGKRINALSVIVSRFDFA